MDLYPKDIRSSPRAMNSGGMPKSIYFATDKRVHVYPRHPHPSAISKQAPLQHISEETPITAHHVPLILFYFSLKKNDF